MAMALLLIFSIVEGVGARQGQPAQANPVLDLPFLTAIFGCWLLAVISCWAFWLAFYYGFRLWLHPGVHSDRRQQRWPPGGDYRPADNRVGCLLFFGLFFVFFHVIIILLIMLLMPGNGLVQIVLQGFWLLGALLTILIGLPVAMLALYAYFVRRFAARSPQECWAPVAMRKPRLADNYDYWAKEAES